MEAKILPVRAAGSASPVKGGPSGCVTDPVLAFRRSGFCTNLAAEPPDCNGAGGGMLCLLMSLPPIAAQILLRALANLWFGSMWTCFM